MDKKTQAKLAQTVRRNYEEICPHFAKTREKLLSGRWGALLAIVRDVPEGARVLDVGCGNGRLLAAFGAKQISYLGIDPCAGLVGEARKRYPGRRFERGNALALDRLEAGEFDYVFSIAVIHHLPGKDARHQALSQMADKLAAGGRIVLSAWNLRAQPRFRALIAANGLKKILGLNRMDFGDLVFPWKGPSGVAASERYYHAFSAKELAKAGQAAGLKIDRLVDDGDNFYLVAGKGSDRAQGL